MKRHKEYKIIIIEPSEIIREGIKMFLERNSSLQVVDSFVDLQAFDNKVVTYNFQVVFFNPSLINFHKTFTVRNYFENFPNICIIAILYQYIDAETLKNFDGILNIYDEGWKIPQKIIKIIENFQPKNDKSEKNIKLSVREKDILIALAKGLTNKEIASKLFISEHTVVSHRKNIIRKTGIKTVSGLTLYALFNNLVSQDILLNNS